MSVHDLALSVLVLIIVYSVSNKHYSHHLQNKIISPKALQIPSLESQTLIIGRREIEILISEDVVQDELLSQFPDELVKIEDAKIHCVVSHVLAITRHKGDRSARSFKQAVVSDELVEIEDAKIHCSLPRTNNYQS